MAVPNDPAYPVIDFGAHLYTEETLPQDPDDPDSEIYDLIGPAFYDPDVAAERFRESGVDYAVISQPYYMGHEDRAETAAANDALLEVIEDYEEFYGLAAIPTAAGGAAAAEEFERALEAGYNGGALETMSAGIELDGEAVEPIYEVAQRHDAPVFVHPKLDDSLQPEADVDPDERPVLTDEYRLNAIFGREAAICESICKVIHGGVLDDHEELNLVFHHTGGNIAGLLGRVHLHLDKGRWPDQDPMKSFPEFRAQLEERVYLDTAGFFGYTAPIEVALKELPATQLLFGTDAPAEPRSARELTRCAEAVRSTASETDAERMLGANALELLANVA